MAKAGSGWVGFGQARSGSLESAPAAGPLKESKIPDPEYSVLLIV